MEAARLVILVCSAAALLVWALVLKRCSIKRRAQAVLMLTWILHGALFTLAAICHWVEPVHLNLWSSIVRTHALVAVIALAIDILTDGGCE